MSLPSDPWFDPGRRAHYLRHSRGDLRLADALCGWDRTLRQALFIDVEELHHGITATYAQAFEARWRGAGHWLLSPTGPLRVAGPLDLNERNRREIDEAISLAPSPRSSEYEVLVKLSLGVWNVMTSARREHDLWVPYVRHAYPRGTRRGAAHYLVTTLRRLRNRICHHESLLDQAVATQHQEIDQLCGLLLPSYQKRFRADSQVAAVLRAPAG